ncbi:MAG: hypothetical protein WEE66_13625 [Actinomycetota bacterium]
MTAPERRCACGNLGHLNTRTGNRLPKCQTCYLSAETREVQRQRERAKRASGQWAARTAAQLLRGDRIMDAANHHKGMAALKAQLGDTRPAGLTLSLVRPDSPNTYDGHVHKRGRRVPYRLTTDPADYAWETRSQNEARKQVPSRA